MYFLINVSTYSITKVRELGGNCIDVEVVFVVKNERFPTKMIKNFILRRKPKDKTSIPRIIEILLMNYPRFYGKYKIANYQRYYTYVKLNRAFWRCSQDLQLKAVRGVQKIRLSALHNEQEETPESST